MGDSHGINLVGEEGIGIDQETGSGLVKDKQERGDVGQDILVERAGRGRIVGGADAEGVGGDDGDLLVKVEGGEGELDGGHGGDQ